MKILHIIPSLSPLRGGPSQAILEMVQAQRQQGIDAAIATTNDHGDATFLSPYGQLVESGSVPELVGPSVPIWVFPRVLSQVAALREFAVAPTLAPWLWQHVADYDLVHIHAIFNYPTTLGMAIAKAKGIPYIVRPIGSLCRWSLEQGKAKKRLYLQTLGRRLLRGSAALHFTTPQEHQEALAAGFDGASFTLPHGVQLPAPITTASYQLRQRLSIDNDAPIVLFLSRLHPKKGLEHLIDAVATLGEEKFTLVIAGSGDADYEAELAQRIKQAGLGRRVRQIGFVIGDWKICLLQGADLFVLPSYSENLGIALLEAMAAGLPVVTTPEVAIAPLIQQHQTGLVTAAHAPALATAIQHYLHHPATARKHGQQGRALVATEFSWPTQAARLLEQYTQLTQPSVEITAKATQASSALR
ncbi:glycosyltransferase [Leptolyngbya sp. CCNP1308]|uniref:glycosyltransferase n=1 Tax=Leptolyngbya sp. CCNP1308 TaxID=3110255 RepID=UPI002B21E23A|nr:glycosyltransferase [Leptolyngbya sp. CCNP1308]MEA5452441.1 glycosyltransferase [Leptolyngbya sp. CCNP1308]